MLASVTLDEPPRLELKNAADPDIRIQMTMASGALRQLIAIEVKGGRDFANIHNRLGEAEKSHPKAKADGYTECWTIVNVDRPNFEKAKQESPTTNRFYLLSELLDQNSAAYVDFRDRIQSLTGVQLLSGSR